MHHPAIPAPLPRAAAWLVLRYVGEADPLGTMAALPAGEPLLIGLGAPLLERFAAPVPGLRDFLALEGPGGACPSTQGDLAVWLRTDGPGEALQATRALLGWLGADWTVIEEVPCYLFAGGRDLTGYEDGTENPAGADALDAAFDAHGGSFLALQRWVHDLSGFEGLPAHAKDAVIGRALADNEELDDAPASAHVKRAAQEDYDPPAFQLRRSMAFGDRREHGLMFASFGADLDRFERVLRRMLGLDDGTPDALMRWSKPVSGGYYWVPPVREGHADLALLGARG